MGRLRSAGVVSGLRVVTAYALTFPASIWPEVLVVWSHIRSTWPPRMSVMAGTVPFYGTVKLPAGSEGLPISVIGTSLTMPRYSKSPSVS